jgi:hypothetical protein
VFRQFHIEGFVNQYALDSLSADGHVLVFNSEMIENAPPGTRAMLTLHVSGDSLNSSFDVAFPGRDFQCYSRTDLERVE